MSLHGEQIERSIGALNPRERSKRLLTPYGRLVSAVLMQHAGWVSCEGERSNCRAQVPMLEGLAGSALSAVFGPRPH